MTDWERGTHSEFIRPSWASEASPTLGCSIEISHDIYIYSRRQYKVSVSYRLLTVPYFKKTPNALVTVPFYSAGRDTILLLYAIRI